MQSLVLSLLLLPSEAAASDPNMEKLWKELAWYADKLNIDEQGFELGLMSTNNYNCAHP